MAGEVSSGSRSDRRKATVESLPFRHTHNYEPVGLDRWDPRPHPGSAPIQPGVRVQKIGKQFGRGRMAFVHVMDERGNHQQVMKGSLQSKRQAMSSSDDAMSWSPDAGEKEIGAWDNIFSDRRGSQ